METPHGPLEIFLHFKEANLSMIQRVISVLERDAPALVEYFGHSPEDAIHIVTRDDRTLANGQARVFPRNVITLFHYPPTGKHYLSGRDDWVRILVVHELAHIIHMDMTTGFLGEIESLFGTIGKWGGIVPNWFAEGLATWAETRFTDGGRGRARMLRWEVDRAILNGQACPSLDCLDNPGVYPHLSNPYWMGWRFLDFLEKKSEGTLSCLVRVNSGKLPFFLNSSFEECTGLGAKVNYNLFLSAVRDQYAGNKIARGRDKFFRRINLPHRGQGIHFQRGLIVGNGALHFVSDDKGRHFINTLNIASGAHDFLPVGENVQSLLSYGNGGLFLSTTRHKASRYPRHLRLLREAKVKEVPLRRGFDYFFPTQEGGLFFSYGENRWHLYRKGSDSSLVSLPPGQGVQSPLLQGEKIIFKSGPRELWEIDLKTSRAKNLLSLEDSFSIRGKCDDRIILAVKEETWALGPGGMETLAHPWPVALVLKDWVHPESVWFFQDDPTGVYTSSAPCGDIISSLAKRESRPRKKETSMSKTPRPIEEIQDYAGWSYLRPTYWFFSLGANSEEASRSEIYTTLSDPLNLHRVDINARYFSGLDRWGGLISYQRDWEYFLTLLGHEKSFLRKIENLEQGSYERTSGAILKAFYWGGADITLGPGLAQEDRRRGGRKRDVTEYFFQTNLVYNSFLVDGFLRRFSLRMRFFEDHVGGLPRYYGGQGFVALGFQPFFRWFLDGQASYGRLAKSGFESGYLTGGGSGGLGFSRHHESYSVGESEAWGNTITSVRGVLGWDFLDVHRGLWPFPARLEGIRLFGGGERLAADRIRIGDQTLKNHGVGNYFLGLRAQAVLGYRLPLGIHLIYSRLNHSYGHAPRDQILFLIQGGNLP